MPDYISGLIARVIQRARESKDPFWFEKAVERMNKTERHVSGQTFIPEDEFVAMLGEFQVSLNEYT